MNSPPPSVQERPEERRARLLAELDLLRNKMKRTDRQFSFAEVCNAHPDVAEILFCGRDLRNTDLRNADLQGIDFRGSDLSGCDFSDALIEGARFEWALVSRRALRRARDWQAYRSHWEAEAVQPNGAPVAPAFFLRRPGEQFSLSPWLPELMSVPSALVPDPSRLDEEERRHLFAHRLAIAVRPLTNWEFTRVVLPSRLSSANEERDPRQRYNAESYCARLNRHPADFGLPPATRATAPSHALFHALAEATVAEALGAAEAGIDEPRLRDLALGQDGLEFVRTGEPGDHSFVTCSIDQPSGHALPFAVEDEREAVLRPIFLLGER